MIVIGHGAVGRCVLSLLCDQLETSPRSITVIDAKSATAAGARRMDDGLTYLSQRFRPDNIDALLSPVARAGDMLINVSSGIDSLQMADWCQSHGVLYVDTTIELWEESLGQDSPIDQTEYMGHQRVRRHAAARWRAGGPTAVFTHGANPGLVTHFTKAALLDVAKAMGLEHEIPADAAAWARLAQSTGTKLIQISERDTQVSRWSRLPGEMANTWSVEGLVKEALMLGEFGWGTHERRLPACGHFHEAGPRNAIYTDLRGAEIQMRSWIPSLGFMTGLAMPHSECVTLSDYLTVRSGQRAVYRPSVSFVYRPCEPAMEGLKEALSSADHKPARVRIMGDDISDGRDELGVLLLGHRLGGWWYGSRLDIHEARRLAPGNNATVLQVAAGVVSAALWALRNPDRGFCEPEDLPHDEILSLASPFLGPLLSRPVEWQAAAGKSAAEETWQWHDFIVTDNGPENLPPPHP